MERRLFRGVATGICGIVLWVPLQLFSLDENALVPLGDVEGEPSALFNNCVNVVSGNYCESDVDMYLVGPEPLTFCRYYSSSGCENPEGLFHGWNHNHESLMHFYQSTNKKGFKAIMTEPSGASLLYCKMSSYPGYKYMDLKLDVATHTRGLTNAAGELSGRTNLKNNILRFGAGKKEVWAYTGAGERRRYTQALWQEGSLRDMSEYFLRKKVSPNGNVTTYDYTDDDLLDNISTTNGDGCAPFAKVHLTREDAEFQHNGFWHMSLASDDGRTVSYTYQVVVNRSLPEFYLQQVVRPNAPTITYSYDHFEHDASSMRLKERRLPDNRFVNIEYYIPGDNHVGQRSVTIGKGDHRPGRVCLQKAPVGTDATPIITGRFFYEFSPTGSGLADVYDARDNKRVYWWNSDQRLTGIDYYLKDTDGNNVLYSKDKLYWGSGHDRTNLVRRTYEDASRCVVRGKQYIYDHYGNVLSDILYGNLTGDAVIQPGPADGKSLPDGAETYTTNYAYGGLMRCQMLQQEDPNGRVTRFLYVPDTDLVAAKFVADGDHILIREFNEYDENAVLIHRIVDDGTTEDPNDLSGVTERHITVIQPLIQRPVGLPGTVEERYLDLNTKQEVLLTRVVNGYSREGYVTSRAVYDANGAHCYTQEFAYDNMGNVIFERDPCGHETRKQYDMNGNKTFEEGPRPGICRIFAYDFSNRLIRQELYDATTRLVETFQYDYLGNRVASTDIFGNETRYTYDGLRRCTEVLGPPTTTNQGERVHPRELRAYDLCNNLACVTTSEGDSTFTTYNARNEPVEVRYPDGTTERKTYNTQGLVVKKVDKNEAVTLYSYDVLGRCIKEDVFYADGAAAGSVTRRYNAFHLLETVDAEGYRTLCDYDGAGRLLRERKMGESVCHVTQYLYDALGRNVGTVVGEGVEAVATKQTLDFMQRVVEERVENGNGEIQRCVEYRYDEAGNRTHVIEHRGDSLATTVMEYNLKGSPIRLQDPEDHFTIMEYNYAFRSSDGVCVLQTQKTDPLGKKTVTTMDAYGRAVSVEEFSPFGGCIARQESCYNTVGSRVAVYDTVFFGEQQEKVIVSQWEYGPGQRVETVISAAGSTDQKVARNVYDAKGRKTAFVKPDGVVIGFVYDDLGRLVEHTGSDGSFHYRYRYDKNGNVIEVQDVASGGVTLRSYDASGRVCRETLTTGLCICNDYDTAGRRLRMTLPDATGVQYRYDGEHLVEVARQGSDGTTRYRHQYTAFDVTGKVIESVQGPHSFHFSYDICGRTQSINAPHYSQAVPPGGYDAAGNLISVDACDPGGPVQGRYGYDALYQLSRETGSVEHEYLYDSVQNRRCKDGRSHQVNDLHQLLDDGCSRYIYDANGNMTQKIREGVVTTFAYDALNRLTAVVTDDRRVEYGYDAFNRRVTRVVKSADGESSTERFLFDSQDEIGVVDEEGSITELRVLGSGSHAEIGAAVSLELRGVLYIPVHDMNGNVVVVIDANSGDAVEWYRYSAFGEEAIFSPQGKAPGRSTVGNCWRFQSKRVDEVAGLVFFGQRVYDPGIGRWTTADPLGPVDGPNLYAYSRNNPLRYKDPLGLQSIRLQPRHHLQEQSKEAEPIDDEDDVPVIVYDDDFEKRHEVQEHRVPSADDTGSEVYTEYYEPSRIFDLGRPELPNGGFIIYINGINNVFGDAWCSAEYVSDLSGGYNVHGVYNATHGIMNDLEECRLNRNYIATTPVRLLVLMLKDRAAKYPGVPMLLVGHSQGVIQALDALIDCPREIRKMVSVVAIAPGGYVWPYLVKDVVHYVSPRDPVPCFDKAGRQKAASTIITLPRHPGCSPTDLDHSFQSPTYKKSLKQRLDRYVTDNDQER